MLDDLRWLGLTWDEGPTFQTARSKVYSTALRRLIETGFAYPCVCSRSEVATAASAPHAEDGSTNYPGTCRTRFADAAEANELTGRRPAFRFQTNEDAVTWDDQFVGRRTYNLQRDLGDFVIAKADGTAAYQLAVVMDDAEAGVTHVVRGDDLLDSTPRQIALYRALGLSAELPREYFHLPLVVGPDLRRLAKRHGDSRLSYYRGLGIPAGRILALLAKWCGMSPVSDTVSVEKLVGRFDLRSVSKLRVVFTAGDQERLVEGY